MAWTTGLLSCVSRGIMKIALATCNHEERTSQYECISIITTC